MTEEWVAAWVALSCAAQGVPVKVTDPGTVSAVRALLTAGDGQAGRRRRSEAPDGGHPIGVELMDARGPRSNDGVVKDGLNDGALARQVHLGPSGTEGTSLAGKARQGVTPGGSG